MDPEPLLNVYALGILDFISDALLLRGSSASELPGESGLLSLIVFYRRGSIFPYSTLPLDMLPFNSHPVCSAIEMLATFSIKRLTAPTCVEASAKSLFLCSSFS